MVQSENEDKYGPSRNLQRLSMMNFACISSVPNLAAEFGVQELLGTVSSSKLSSHQMPIRSSPGVQKVIASLISSELSSHQMAIRGQPGVQRVTASLIPSKLRLPSNGYLQPFGTLQILGTLQTTSAYLGRLDASTVDSIHTLRVPVPSGEFPRQARAPIVPHSFCRHKYFFPGILYSMRVRWWTP